MSSVQQKEKTPLEAALDYGRRGWAVIDLPLGSKVPGREGWQNERYDEKALARRLAAGPRNVSVLFGEPSGGLVDVDLDSVEARSLASGFLPETAAVFGRPGSRGSHSLYVADPVAKYRKFADPEESDGERASLVEIRSGGQHTIVPPSVHPSGETVTWERYGKPARVSEEDLTSAVGRLAAAALLVRRWDKPGQRNDQALALAGGLLGGGWDENEATCFIEAVARAAGDEEWRGRGKSVETTARKLAAGDPVTGWPRLAELLGDKVAGKAREWLGMTAGREGGEADDQAKPSQADKLVRLGETAHLFHDPNGEGYATIAVGGHKETHRLATKGFKNWLRHRFYSRYEKSPSSQALQDALGTLEGKAVFAGPEHEVRTRLAEKGDAIYLDLGGKEWEAVEITSEGWRIIPSDRGPVRFRRARGMQPLPHPDEDGDLSGLRGLLNLPEDDEGSWVLLLSWLAAALRPTGPYPILILQGEQGSAKSTAQRMLRALVDPSTVPLRTAPREERDLMSAATNGWCVAFDNLSGLPVWLSDALCRLATGGGFGARQLYTDQEEVLFSAVRPTMLNGIADVASRPDLLDRSLIVELPVIPEGKRRTEREIWAEFGAEHPKILGALLDAVSCAMESLPQVRLERLPRMAEFAEWATAAEGGLGLQKGVFMRAYGEARSDAVGQALEGDLVAEAVLAFMGDRSQWLGTATDLLSRIAPKASEDVRRTKAWPKTPQHLSNGLKRLAPPLRSVGLEYTPDAGRKGPNEPRRKRLRWTDGPPERGRTPSSTPSTSSTPTPEPGRDALPETGANASMDGGEDGVDGAAAGMDDAGGGAEPRANTAVDGMDGVDDAPPSRSGAAHIARTDVLAILRDPPGWLRPVLENYRDGYERRGRIDGREVIWRMDLRTVANNVASALGLSPTEGEDIRTLVKEALAHSEFAKEAMP